MSAQGYSSTPDVTATNRPRGPGLQSMHRYLCGHDAPTLGGGFRTIHPARSRIAWRCAACMLKRSAQAREEPRGDIAA